MERGELKPGPLRPERPPPPPGAALALTGYRAAPCPPPQRTFQRTSFLMFIKKVCQRSGVAALDPRLAPSAPCSGPGSGDGPGGARPTAPGTPQRPGWAHGASSCLREPSSSRALHRFLLLTSRSPPPPRTAGRVGVTGQQARVGHAGCRRGRALHGGATAHARP
uniref:Uncharacterized protein n=1 Tax=Rangifer tarandus platyrhynchus TaxID=3082113 RepID=A0ACB0E4K3_RANTA|nr:unnamed protein product [Rangifer tarandus platyrhynchus]